MIDLAKIYYFIFGVLTIAGGVIGFTKGSQVSLVAGGISGVLLLLAGYLTGSARVQAGLILGLVVSLALTANFVRGLMAGKTMPALPMVVLGTIGVIVSAAALLRK